MKEKGWAIASSRAELNALVPGDKQVYAYYSTSFTRNSLDCAIDMEADDVSLASTPLKGSNSLIMTKGIL